MLDIKSVYEDVVNDAANTAENGRMSVAMFNRMSRRGELRLMQWLSGDVAGQVPPLPFLTQKNKDWLSPFIVEFPAQAAGGRITRPDNYYLYQNMYRLGNKVNGDCEEEENPLQELGNKEITLLEPDAFDIRFNTNIKELKPSLFTPIAKQIGRQFQFGPSDIGSLTLCYLRYPVFGRITSTIDPVYNDEVIQSLNDYEWDENSREALVYFITNSFADHNRERALKETIMATGKGERG